MYEIKIIREFSAAHRVEEYPGNCEKLHGHNWKVEVSVSREKLDNLGMVIDFRKLKSMTEKVIKPLDHSFMNDLDIFSGVNPTAENIARYIYVELAKKAQVSSVTVWESDASSASYFEEDSR